MTYILSPFTDYLLQLLMIGPFWILYLATVTGLVGLILYRTDKGLTVGLVTLLMTGGSRVKISKAHARSLGLALLAIALILGTGATDAIASSPATILTYGTGGPSFLPCPVPFDNLPCYHPGGPGISCSSTVPSPCWTQVQNGTKTCTINVGLTSCTSVVTFNPAYSKTPKGDVGFSGATVAASVTENVAVPVPTTLFFQAVNNTNWKLIPAVNTTLFGHANQYLEWTTPTSWTSQTGQFCMDVSNTTSLDTPSFFIQYATVLSGPWTGLGSAGFGLTPAVTGFQCGLSQAINLAQNTLYYFRVVGNDATGFNPGTEPDDIGLGLIELYMTGTFTSSFNISVGCTTTVSVAPSPTVMTVGTTCGTQGIAAQKTFTMNWWAGIPG